MTGTTGTVERLAARLRLTEGQLYSSTITLAMAALLAAGLGNIHGVVSTSLDQPLLAPEIVTALPPLIVPTPAPAPAPGVAPAPPALAPFTAGAAPLPMPPPLPPPYSAAPFPSEAPPPSPDPTPSPTPTPCTAQPVADTGAGLVWTLDGVAGGGLPDEDLIAAITLVSGCQPPDRDPSPSPSGSAGALG